MATRRVSAPMSSAAELRRFEIQGAHERRKELGRGAYGEVKVYEVDGVPCAGKVMHEFLLRSAGGDGVRRYIDECKLLAKLGHPNIVQFMGVTFPRGAALPVLLMERLPIDLDGLLENTPNIPIGIRATFLTDIARGLNYLHSQRPPVIHRDLSARNVLLSAILVAKISDLGNARIVNLSPNEVSRLTHAPGCPLYMPPEAFETSPSYGPSLDVFSFGQIALFAATQVFPQDLLPSTHPDPGSPGRLLGRSEVERRECYFTELQQQLGEGHPLEGLIKECLDNSPSRRPTAEQLLSRLEEVGPVVRGSQDHTHKLQLMKQLRDIEAKVQSKPVPHWEEWRGWLITGGDRDLIIIASFGEAAARIAGVVPRSPHELTEEDKRRMVDQGLSPEECTDDISILQARLRLDKKHEMVEMLVNEGTRELTRGHILERLESQFKATEKAGVVVYYLGHGKRDTGDWCFQDGFITFNDIAELYSRYLRGRALTIISDCSHSGAWTNACLDYLDERGVRPCGHSAKEKGILIKVYASCQPQERAAANCFFVQVAKNDPTDGTLLYDTMALSESQHSYVVSTTVVTCKKSAEEACALRPEFTWRKWREGERIQLVRGKDHGRAAWHYVLFNDDPEKTREFYQAVASGHFDVAGYGKLLKSGWGRDPPQEVVDEINRPYQFML